MQTTYPVAMTPALAGMPLLAPRKSRPRQLAKATQVLSLTIANGAGTDDVDIVATDTRTGQAWTLPTVTGSANEATLGAAIRAAVAADPKFNSLFTVAATQESSGSDLILAFTCRQANRSFGIVATGGPVSAATVSTATESTAAGGSGLAFGQLVARGTNDDEFAAMTASTTVSQIAGMLFRSDANHFHALPADFGDESPSDSDLCLRSVHYPIAEDGEFWVTAAEAVTPASRVHVRVEGSSVGDWGDTPAGTAQTATFTVVADHQNYACHVGVIVNGATIDVPFSYNPTDGTTATDDVVDGLEDAAAAAITALGLGSILAASAASNAATFVITATVGYQIAYAYVDSFGEDTEAVGGTAVVTAADVDMLDVSSIARYTSTAAAGALVKVKLQLQP